MPEEEEEEEEIRCPNPKCGVKSYYYRQSDGKFVCKSCGTEWKEEEEKQ